MNSEFIINNFGVAEGPTSEMLAAAPYHSLGFWALALAFLVFSISAGAIALKVRAAGGWLTVSGLIVVLSYFAFQNTFAPQAELRYGPWAEAIALIAYGTGSILIAAGYTRLVLHVLKGVLTRPSN